MSAGERRWSSLNRDWLTYDITAYLANGTKWYPGAGATFEAAFLADPGNPESGDWKAGVFGQTVIGTVTGLCMIGPGSTAGPLAAGKCYEWVRVSDPTQNVIHVECVGVLIVE